MITPEGLKAGRVRVSSGERFAEVLERHSRTREGDLNWVRKAQAVLAGMTRSGRYSFPYPGDVIGDGPVVVLNREQTEALAVSLLKNLAPGGKLPTDAAELLDFIAALLRDHQKE